MVNFKRLADRAKDVIDKRGGTGALKEDAQELRDIAREKGSLTDKAKAAGEAIKDPGAKGPERSRKAAPSAPPEPDGPATRSK
jgi:general stress protein YciG